jgi:hypothetical protein
MLVIDHWYYKEEETKAKGDIKYLDGIQPIPVETFWLTGELNRFCYCYHTGQLIPTHLFNDDICLGLYSVIFPCDTQTFDRLTASL